MRILPYLTLLLILPFGTCAPPPENADVPSDNAENTTTADPAADLPPTLQTVLTAHGGLDRWRGYRTLSYDMARDESTESQTTDLNDRREYIRQPAPTGEPTETGFDGDSIWLKAGPDYQGNPRFYHNLMFYFYAMPWVLADPGITYEATPDLTYGGVSYPGLKISYADGVGLSPKDNYFLHHDPATGRMRWLGYTVTARTGEVSDKISWIEYPTFSDHGGVMLADSLVWYTVEDNQPVAPRNTRTFTNVRLDKTAADYTPPAGARAVD